MRCELNMVGLLPRFGVGLKTKEELYSIWDFHLMKAQTGNWIIWNRGIKPKFEKLKIIEKKPRG